MIISTKATTVTDRVGVRVKSKTIPAFAIALTQTEKLWYYLNEVKLSAYTDLVFRPKIENQLAGIAGSTYDHDITLYT